MRGIASFFEPILHRTYGSIGVFCSQRPFIIVSTIIVALVALCIGIHVTESENNLNDLLIARRGRINREKNFYVDNFDLISPVLSSVIVTPKEGVDILSVEALDELYQLQEHIRTFTFEYKEGLNVSLEQFCFRLVNADPTENCYQSSILESFREGAVFNVGGELNTNYAAFFAPRPSYRDFDFKNDFKRSFIAATNQNPDSLMLGEFEVAEDQDTIISVKALQVAFGAKSPNGLQRDGLQYFEWVEREVDPDSDAGFCPDVARCAQCADDLQANQFAAAGCTFDGASSQSDSCCAALSVVRASPCIETVFERRVELLPIANGLFTACRLDTVEVSQRCQNQLLYENRTGPPEVCVCLAGPSDACTAAAPLFLAENPEYNEVFAAAANGTEEQVAEFSRTLVENIGCPATANAPEVETEQPAANAPTVETEQTTQASAPPTQYDATVTVIRRETDTIDKARKVMHEWEKAWREQMWDRAAEFKYIDVTWMTSTSLDDEVRVAAEAEFGLIVLGYGLVLVYLAMFCSFDWKLGRLNFTWLPPGPGMSALCFFMILLSVVAAMGVAGYVSSVSSFKITFITIQMLPLLMLGLGVNDFFVLVSALKSVLLKPDRPQTTAGIMYEMMAVGGTSITLSSAANTCAFSLATLSPVPVVLWFSVHMAVGVVIAYIVSITAIPALLSLAVKRFVDEKPDVLFALFGVNPLANEAAVKEPVQGEVEGTVAQFIRKYRWVITAIAVAVFGVWMGFGVHGFVHFKQGVDFSKAVVKDSYPYNFLVNTQDYFDTNQINIVFKTSADYSDRDSFQLARKAEFEYVYDGYRTEQRQMTRSWLELYTQYVEDKFCLNEICMDMVNWYFDGFSAKEYNHPTKDICASLENPEDCERTCQTHCPQGPVDSIYRCEYVPDRNQCYCPYRPMLNSTYFYENPPGFDSKIRSYWADFLMNTPTGSVSRVFINFAPGTNTTSNPMGTPKATRAYVFTRELQDIPHQLRHVRRGRDILEGKEILERREVWDRREIWKQQGLAEEEHIDSFAFDFTIYGMGEHYDGIALRTVAAIGISMAVATVVMMPLITHWFAAVLVAGCVLLGVLLAVGTTSWTVLDMDYGAYVAFIIAVGLAVEFCAHIARDFMLTQGDRVTRVLHALRTMGIAVFNGGVTTFLGILPAALSNLPSIRDRLFVQYSCVVLAGTFTGLVILPTVLSLIGPPAYQGPSTSTRADEENQGPKKKEVEMN